MTTKATEDGSDTNSRANGSVNPQASPVASNKLERILTEYLHKANNLGLVDNGNVMDVIKEAETDISQLITEREADKLEELKRWIERNHLGKGFDGTDRWEHCASEIIAHITALQSEQK